MLNCKTLLLLHFLLKLLLKRITLFELDEEVFEFRVAVLLRQQQINLCQVGNVDVFLQD